jgi:hypothetical protein
MNSRKQIKQNENINPIPVIIRQQDHLKCWPYHTTSLYHNPGDPLQISHRDQNVVDIVTGSCLLEKQLKENAG